MAWLWKAEYEYLISSLSERLDIAKHKKFLIYSLDAWLAQNEHPNFVHYFFVGRNVLVKRVEAAMANLHNQFHSGHLYSVMCACCVDDVNLAHVWSIVRGEELMENYTNEAPITFQASILLAMIGELTTVRDDFVKCGDLSKYKNFRDKNARFLSETNRILIDLVIECGRDRATYMKEAMTSPTFTPPRPRRRADADKEAKKRKEGTVNDDFLYELSNMLTNDVENRQKNSPPRELFLNSLQAMYERGDTKLEALLHSGSIFSLWSRLYLLYDAKRKSSLEMIRWAIIRQAPQMNRGRQLIFTRLLQTLVRPIWSTRLGTTLVNFKSLSNSSWQDLRLIRLIFDSFIESGVRVWSYEDDSQLEDFRKATSLSPSQKFELMSVMSIKVDRNFVELPLDIDIPDMETLAEMFVEWKSFGRNAIFDKLNISDATIYRSVPLHKGAIGFPELPTTKRTGNRLHGIVPDFGVAGEMRFFSTPLMSALIDQKKFAQTVDAFFNRSGKDLDIRRNVDDGIV